MNGYLIESYGQTVIDRDVFRERISQMYARLETELDSLGFVIASSILDSPTYASLP